MSSTARRTASFSCSPIAFNFRISWSNEDFCYFRETNAAARYAGKQRRAALGPALDCGRDPCRYHRADANGRGLGEGLVGWG